jgi:hypothetical protein
MLRTIVQKRILLGVTCLLAGTGLLTLSTGTALASPIISAVNGAQMQLGMSQSQWGQQLSTISAAGITMVRSDASWSSIERQQNQFNWADSDAWVAALAQYGLTWEPVIDYCVSWAKTWVGQNAICSTQEYADFAQQVAQRYGSGGAFWAANPQLQPARPAQIFELWNEEGNQPALGLGDGSTYVAPEQYAQMYLLSHKQIHDVDPAATVIVGGLGVGGSFDSTKDYPANYVYRMVVAQPSLIGNIDGIGLHPYGSTATDAIEWVQDFRHRMVSIGLGGVAVDLTEFGWPESTGESWRAQQFSELGQTLGNSNCGLGMLEPYDWIDPYDAGNPESDFGLVDPSGSLRQSEQSWLSGLSQAAAGPVQTVC